MKTKYLSTSSLMSVVAICTVLLIGSCGDDGPMMGALPILTTNPVQMITGTAATMGGNVTDEGGSTVSIRGVCWSLNSNPTINDNSKTADGSGAGSFSVEVTGLDANTTYHVRAFAENNEGLSYGNDITFSTDGLVSFTAEIPRDITSARVNLKATATVSGTSGGGKGFALATSSNPTIDDIQWSDGVGSGDIDVAVDNLTPNTTYFARPYIYADVAYYYGEEFTFKTVGYAGPAGGYVVYDKGEETNGWRYFEATPELNINQKWGCSGQFLTNTSAQIGTGLENTNQIVANCGDADCAARACSNYSYGGFSDWFLPSREEALLIIRSLDENSVSTPSNYSWSSTESASGEAYWIFGNGVDYTSTPQPKNFTEWVLPIRRY